MRVTLLFMVLGGIFTIGAAYIHDTNHPLGSPRRFGTWQPRRSVCSKPTSVSKQPRVPARRPAAASKQFRTSGRWPLSSVVRIRELDFWSASAVAASTLYGAENEPSSTHLLLQTGPPFLK
jgi:hypothetical protein